MDIKKNTHTPGPWIWAQDYQGLYGAGPDNQVLAFYHCEGMHLGENNKEGNAALLSAAPDMLKALRGMHAAVDVLMARMIELDNTFYPTKSIFWADVMASSALLERFK